MWRKDPNRNILKEPIEIETEVDGNKINGKIDMVSKRDFCISCQLDPKYCVSERRHIVDDKPEVDWFCKNGKGTDHCIESAKTALAELWKKHNYGS